MAKLPIPLPPPLVHPYTPPTHKSTPPATHHHLKAAHSKLQSNPHTTVTMLQPNEARTETRQDTTEIYMTRAILSSSHAGWWAEEVAECEGETRWWVVG